MNMMLGFVVFMVIMAAATTNRMVRASARKWLAGYYLLGATLGVCAVTALILDQSHHHFDGSIIVVGTLVFVGAFIDLIRRGRA